MKVALKKISIFRAIVRYTISLRASLLKVSRDLLDHLVQFTIPRPSPRNLVLIVRLDGVGDFVLWLDAARTLVNDYHAQGYRVVLLGDQIWARWADEMHLADEVWGLDVQRFVYNLPYRWHWSRRIRKAGFTIAIQPTYSFSRRSLLGDSAIFASGAPIRIGSVGDSTSTLQKRKTARLYTDLIPATNGPMMEIQRNAEFMRGLGFNDFKARLPNVSPSLDKRPEQFLPQPYAVIFPGAGWDGKKWQISKFSKIGHRLALHGLSVVLAGGKADCDRACEFIKEKQGDVIDLVGKTSLSDLTEVLRSAKIVITNDSSAMHIGAAVGVPVVSIMGGGHYGRFAPYDIDVEEVAHSLPLVIIHSMPCFGCNWACIHPRGQREPVKCISDISVEDVWTVVERII